MPVQPFPGEVAYKRQKDGYYAVYYFSPALGDERPQACMYLRVSSRRQSEEDKHSLPEQWRLNWEAAERCGYATTAVYIDVLSGANRHRKDIS